MFAAIVATFSVISLIRSIRFLIASILSPTFGRIASAFWSFCDNKSLVESDRLRISSATTANPLPCSPARAASMDAFRESRFVCPAIEEISSLLFLYTLMKSDIIHSDSHTNPKSSECAVQDLLLHSQMPHLQYSAH